MTNARGLYIVVCGAPLASRAGDGILEARKQGWTPVLVPTEAGRRWTDQIDLHGALVRHSFYPPDDTPSPPVDAVAVVPATFNTINGWANGDASTYPMTLLCSALGSRIPTVAVPFAKSDLTGHPAWLASLAVLQYAGVTLLDAQTGIVGHIEPVASGHGDRIASTLSWRAVLEPLRTPQ